MKCNDAQVNLIKANGCYLTLVIGPCHQRSVLIDLLLYFGGGKLITCIQPFNKGVAAFAAAPVHQFEIRNGSLYLFAACTIVG